MHRNDVRNRLYAEARKNPPTKRTWWSLSRTESAGTEFGYGAKLHTRATANIMQISTQQILGMMSLQTLKEILRAGWS